MPVFDYKARSRKGERKEGSLEAPDRRAALRQMESQGLVPVSVVESGADKSASKGQRFSWRLGKERMGTRDVLTFTTELSDLLASGMTLGNALNCLANRKTGKANDKIIASVRDEIIRGSSLSDSMEQHTATFSGLYINMIRAGEASGALSEVLRRLVAHYERIQETKEKVVMALVYPAIVLSLGVLTLIFSMVVVVPKFSIIFEQMDQALPLPTQILIGSSQWLARYGVFLLIGIIIGFIMANRAVKTKQGRLWWHGFILKMPLIRGVVASGIYSNFARTLGTLLANGVPVLRALQIVEQTVGNVVIGRELSKARDRVTDGTTISGPLAAGKVLPVMMTDMLAIGEQTGDMTGALTHIARRYENELDRNVKIFTTALEPILIVFVAVMVGFVAVSILMAVFNLTNGLDV
ncbi:MAG: type II secretion system F family protein [Kiritimatiellia bacterium]|jgi:type II secretory pathway component PulF|nr:type II secretion system F family protein [Kiritimatiellia bacterium]